MSNDQSFSIPPEQFIETLYQLCLGRSSDAPGREYWAQVIRSTGDPTRVLKGILESSECAQKSPQWTAPDCTVDSQKALERLTRRIRIVDVGAQSLGVGTHPYDGLLKITDPEIIGFDPLDQRIRERSQSEASALLTLLPFAIGDGGTHTLHINDFDATSSLFPLNEPLNSCFDSIHTQHTVETRKLQTHRLDDVLPDGPVDFLKLDVQGAELMALKGAEQTLSQTAVVHCEGMLSPMYVGQPLFPEIQQHLAARQFSLIDILISHRYHYLTPSKRQAPDRLLWADFVFFRETSDPETQRVQSLIAASVYRKPTLAEHLLLQAARPR